MVAAILFWGCGKKISPDPGDTVIEASAAKADLRTFASILKKAHPSLYLYLPEKRFDFLTDSLSSTITTTVTLNDFFNKLYCIVGRVGCSHTDIAMPPAVYDSLQNRQFFFPFPVEWIDGRLLVNVRGYDLSQGTEIRRINGKPAETIIRELMLYNSVEGLSRETQKRMAGADFSFQYYLKYGPQKLFNLEVTDTSGMEKTVKMSSIKLSEWEQRFSGDIYYFDDVSVGHDLNINDANGYAIMRISTFEFNQEKQQQAFEHFCNNSFELLRAKPNITNLIIDLRQNPGGDLYNAFYLFSYLAREPFLQYATVYSKVSKLPFSNLLDEEFSGDKETEINQSIAEKFTQRVKSGYWKYADSFNRQWVPDPNAFKGKIFLVTNAKVNSAASYFALMVKNSGIGTIVGEETAGGSYSGNGFTTIKYKLPNTGIRLFFPYAHIVYNYKPEKNNARGLEPNYLVPDDRESFKKNTDRQLYFIIDSLISGLVTNNKR